MQRPKITEVGKLKLLDDGGLVCLVISDQPPPLWPSARAASVYWASPGPSDLAVGNLVVHAEHGLARYRGRESLNDGSGEKRDFLVLEFADDRRLYVPDDRSEIVQKLGDTDHAPIKLSTPGAKGAKGDKWLQSYCVEVLPNSYEWPGIGALPELPQGTTTYVGRQEFPTRHKTFSSRYQALKAELEARKVRQKALLADQELMAKWRRDCVAYRKALHADASYRQAAQEYFERQGREPQPLLDWCWVYRTVAVRVGPIESASVRDGDGHLLLIKRYVLRREREGEKLRREVETLENYENLESAGRESIPQNVRLFVWRRDNGQCVKCGSRERLEFDHIIPVVAGGSNTERNIQILCESCNRSKGATV